ncbi:MAG: glycosyltransferase family 4 protein [Patescibacteria group bacterium]
MKLLIISQKADKNDQVLGFFHCWVEEFAKNCEEIKFICLEKGVINLPANVEIFSLGKNNSWQKSKLNKLFGKIRAVYNFYFIVFSQTKNYDAVFVHMNPEYIILGGWWWKLVNKKISMWYAHGTVNIKLKLAIWLADIVFTSTDQGLPVTTPKKIIVGQGIDTEFFKFYPRLRGDIAKLLSVGRISETKDCLFIIKIAEKLHQNGVAIKLFFVGDTVTLVDKKYKAELLDYIKENNLGEIIEFVGSKTSGQVLDFLHQADIMLSASRNKSLDKTIVEAIATGLPVLTANDSGRVLLSTICPDCIFTPNDLEEAVIKAGKILSLNLMDYYGLGQNLRQLVETEHSLNRLIKEKILAYLQND